MKKEFCTYEQSLALKELGFKEETLRHWKQNGSFTVAARGRLKVTNAVTCSLTCAPLKQQAFRFFREKYNLVFNFISYNIVKPGEYHWSITWNDEAKAGGIVKTYEEAESACLDKLIEIIKTKTNG